MKPVRIAFCTQFLQNDESQLNLWMMTNKSHEHLSGYGNKLNYHYWSEVNLQQVHEKPPHNQRVNVW